MKVTSKMKFTIASVTATLFLAAAWGVAFTRPSAPPPPLCQGADYLAIVEALSHDTLRGRAPGTRGGNLAARYLAASFAEAGLEPLGDDGYLQWVPVERVYQESAKLAIDALGARSNWRPTRDFIAYSETNTSIVVIEDAVLFVGFGISAPQFGWDDLDGVDLRGRIVAMYRGQPDSLAAATGTDLTLISADERKLDMARAKGASGVLFLLREDEMGRIEGIAEDLALGMVQPGRLGARLEIVALLGGAPATALVGGLDPSKELRGSASMVPQEPHWLPGRISTRLERVVASIRTPNVLGFVPGTGDNREIVMITAHYDGLGIGPADSSADSIYNGARDNASGAAALVCLARALGATAGQRSRGVLLMATAAEEWSHLGVRHYLKYPAWPLSRTVAVLNADGLNIGGLTPSYQALGLTALDDAHVLVDAARQVGLELVAPNNDAGFDDSFDTFEFNTRGIPALTLWNGGQYESLDSLQIDYLRSYGRRIHQPSDESFDFWSGEAATQHLQLFEQLANALAQPTVRLRHTPGGRFDLLREIVETW